ncbi:MAG: histidinol-phosphatase [Verrucomicrobiota bacterium]
MFADYHTHTPLCHHAEGTPAEFASAALALDLQEYGISDHSPHLPEPFDDWRMAMADLPRYFDWIAEVKQIVTNKITIRSGLECDWLPDCQTHTEHLRQLYDWDYFIGSIHYLPTKSGSKWDFDNPAHLSKWKALSENDLDDLWTHYWNEYRTMIESGLFDICGHPDLIKKFAFRPSGDLKRFYEPTIQALLESGTIFELNTAGWHKPCAEQYPADEFLTLAASANIPLVINSDAHHPSELGRDFPKARQLARNCGFSKLALLDGNSIAL